MNKKEVLLRYFTNRGREVKRACSSVEDAILKGRMARTSGGANFRKYSLDNGKTWYNI